MVVLHEDPALPAPGRQPDRLVPLVLGDDLILGSDPAVVPVQPLAPDEPARLDADEQHVAPGAELLDDLLPAARVDAELLDALVQVLLVLVVPLGLLRGEHHPFRFEELLVERSIVVQGVGARDDLADGVGPRDAGVGDEGLGGRRAWGAAGAGHNVRHGPSRVRVVAGRNDASGAIQIFEG